MAMFPTIEHLTPDRILTLYVTKNIYLQFASSLHINMTQASGILSHVREELTFST